MSQQYLQLCLLDPPLVKRLEDCIAHRLNQDDADESHILGRYPTFIAAIANEVDDARYFQSRKEKQELFHWIINQINVELNCCLQDCDLSLEDSLNKCKELNQLKLDLQSAFKNNRSLSRTSN